MAEQGVNPLLKLFADMVLQPLGLLMHFVPPIAQRLHQIEFQQAMMPDDLQRHLLPGWRQPHALVGRMRTSRSSVRRLSILLTAAR